MSYIAVIGAGSWGTTLAIMLAAKDYDVSLWTYERELAEEMARTKVNSLYLPDAVLPDNIKVSWQMEEALRKTRYFINVVPTQHTRSVLNSALPHLSANTTFVSASKGIEKDSHLTVSGIIRELTGASAAVLSGPSFAKEVVKKLPAAVTLACEDYSRGLLLQEMFTFNYFRVYTHYDVLGVELGGALKNIYAIASGISDGLGLGMSARAALITRGLSEMTRLGVMLGAKEHTFTGLSGLGDLVLTCTSPISRNYDVGLNLGMGIKLNDILSASRAVAEGVETTAGARDLALSQHVEMPIIEQVYKVLYDDKSPREAVHDLMNRTLKAEFYG